MFLLRLMWINVDFYFTVSMIQKGGFDTTYLFTSLTDVVQDNKVIFLVQYYVKML